MKILITYYSMTGNTELVAKSMHDGLSGEDVTIKKVEDVDPLSLKSYDLVLLGSGIYAARFHKTIKTLLKTASELPSKCALFYTHATQDMDMYQTFPQKIRKITEKSGSTLIGEFECLGENKNITEEKAQEMLESLPPDERKRAKEQRQKLKGHPNVEDLTNAKEFVKSLI